jgi:hypothetical protein
MNLQRGFGKDFVSFKFPWVSTLTYNQMSATKPTIFERMLAGGLISFSDPEYPHIF